METDDSPFGTPSVLFSFEDSSSAALAGSAADEVGQEAAAADRGADAAGLSLSVFSLGTVSSGGLSRGAAANLGIFAFAGVELNLPKDTPETKVFPLDSNGTSTDLAPVEESAKGFLKLLNAAENVAVAGFSPAAASEEATDADANEEEVNAVAALRNPPFPAANVAEESFGRESDAGAKRDFGAVEADDEDEEEKELREPESDAPVVFTSPTTACAAGKATVEEEAAGKGGDVDDESSPSLFFDDWPSALSAFGGGSVDASGFENRAGAASRGDAPLGSFKDGVADFAPSVLSLEISFEEEDESGGFSFVSVAPPSPSACNRLRFG